MYCLLTPCWTHVEMDETRSFEHTLMHHQHTRDHDWAGSVCSIFALLYDVIMSAVIIPAGHVLSNQVGFREQVEWLMVVKNLDAINHTFAIIIARAACARLLR